MVPSMLLLWPFHPRGCPCICESLSVCMSFSLEHHQLCHVCIYPSNGITPGHLEIEAHDRDSEKLIAIAGTLLSNEVIHGHLRSIK